MESQPQNPELRNNPENFHQCILLIWNFVVSVVILQEMTERMLQLSYE